MKPTVIVFSTPTCSWCKKVKEYLKTNGQQFKDIDVSKDLAAQKDMVKKSGQLGVPQIWVNNVAVVGFDRVKIDKLLSINKKEKGETNV